MQTSCLHSPQKNNLTLVSTVVSMTIQPEEEWTATTKTPIERLNRLVQSVSADPVAAAAGSSPSSGPSLSVQHHQRDVHFGAQSRGLLDHP